MKRVQKYAFVVCASLAFFILPLVRPALADDWLPVPPEDLALTDNPKQPGADAMVLYRNNVVNAKQASYDGDSDEEYIRIKVFTQAGAKYANVEIPFVKSQSDVRDVRGRTIHADGSIVEFSGQVLESTVVKRNGLKVLEKTFTLPDVKPGSIIEYQYRLQGIPQYLHNERWTVSQEIFTREAHFKMIPYTAYGGMNLEFRVYLLPAGALPKRAIDGTFAMTVNDIPAVVDEPLMPPETILTPRVEFFYRSNGEPDSESTKDYWARMDKTANGELEKFLDKKGALTQEVSHIVSPGDSADVKLRKIYARVLQIRNLNMEASKTQQEKKSEDVKPNSNVEDVLTHGYGGGRDINSLFVGLARAAGFESTVMEVAARNRALLVPDMQDAGQLTADIAWVRADGKEYYLDPAAEFYPFGILPWYESDTEGLRLNKQGGELVGVPLSTSSDAKIVRRADLQVNEDGSVSAKVQVDFTGQQGALRREENRQQDETGRKRALEDEIRSWLPTGSSFEITNIADWDKTEEPLHIEGTAKIPVFGTATGRRILAPSELFVSRQASSFDSQKRVNNVYFNFPYEEDDDLKLQAPAGYTVEVAPKLQKMDQGAVKYQLSATQQGDAVEVNRQLVINGVMFSKDTYPVFRSFFNLVKSDDDSQIVLSGSASAKN